MARQIVDIGVEGNDGTGDSIRESFRKSNENFRELYAVFGQGGQISFTDLDDVPTELSIADSNKLVAINNTGTALVFKNLVSGNDGILISTTDTEIVITNQSSSLKTDPAPELAFSLNASDQSIGYLRNPDENTVRAFNSTYSTSLNLDGRDFAVNKGYIENTFVHSAGDTMTGALNVPSGATGTEVPQAQEVVMRAGDTMTGALHLNDHPEAWDGVTPPDNTDYRAVSKYYVDNVNNDINTTIEEAGFASQDYVDEITGAMHEPTGYNRNDLDSMGIFEFTIDGITIYQINQNEIGSVRADGKFATGTVWERPATAQTAAMYPVPTRSEFYVWQNGQKYSYTNLISTVVPVINGSHYFFINDGVLERYGAIGSGYLQTRPFTALVYCNEAKNQVVVIGEERHGIQMDGTTHYYLHTTVGTRYRSGLGVAGITAGSATYNGTASGIMYDEDIIINVPTQTSNRHFYLDGSMWGFLPENNNLAHIDAGVAYYNRQVSPGIFDLYPIPSGKFVLVYFLSTNCSLSHTVKIMGQRLFDNIAEASDVAQSEPRELVFLGLPVAEFLYVGCVVVDSTGQVQSLEDGSTYVDLRQININAGINLTAAVQVNAVDVFFDKTQSGLNSYDVQSALNEVLAPSGYLDKRLGLTKTNTVISQGSLIGPGFLDRNGLLAWYGGSATPSLKNPLNMSGARISNVGSPNSDSDAANKLYVDGQSLSNATVDTTTAPAVATNDLLVFNGSKWVNASNNTGSDISLSLDTKSVTLGIKSDVIVDANVNEAAAINQTKLDLSNAYATTTAVIIDATATRSSTTATLTFAEQVRAPFNTGQRITVTGFATTGYNGTFTVLSCDTTTVTYTIDSEVVTPGIGAGTITSINGVASFDNSKFTATNGWISLAASTSTTTGISLDNIQYIGGTSILGRRNGTSGPPQELSPSNIVTDGDGIKNASFVSSGAMTVIADSPNTYTSTAITTTGSANSLVKTDENGIIDVKALKIDGYTVLDTVSTTIKLTTPGGVESISAAGATDETATMSIKAGAGLTVFGSISTSGASTNITAVNQVNAPYGSFTTSVTTPLLTTGGSSTAGVVTGNWSLSSGSKLQATYADLAEYYEGDAEYAPGTIVVFGGNKEVTIANTLGDQRVAGVVTTNPAYTMNAECPGIKVCVALQGRVPCNVIGPVQKGEMLVASSTPGYAVVSKTPTIGSVIGKALQSKESITEGVIEVAVGRI